MGKYQLTNKAEIEIEEIYEYSIINFGLARARKYVLGLHEKFELLADNQTFGIDYSFINIDIYRYEYLSHSIYYQCLRDEILVVRVLGNKQDPARHF